MALVRLRAARFIGDHQPASLQQLAANASAPQRQSPKPRLFIGFDQPTIAPDAPRLNTTNGLDGGDTGRRS
jgi:hypothetical protein